MCGIFGAIRPAHYPTAQRTAAAAALLDLGAFSEERGVDSAGLATFHTRTLGTDFYRDETIADLVQGKTRILTALGAFSDTIPSQPRIRSNLQTSWLVLGHTRWATQGKINLFNASPARVQDVIGTHNGDVTVPIGSRSTTDSAWIFAQLNRAATPKSVTAVLTGLRGRAALAWTRLSQPRSLYLARAALSPLAITTDAAGALWWASNPEWLRKIDQQHTLAMKEPTMLEEGTLLRIQSHPENVQIQSKAVFLPTCRRRDERIASYAVWRGFNTWDQEADQESLLHRVTDRERAC